MNVILSIKPEYVRKILTGEKKFEYRKRIWKDKVKKIYIYSSRPEKKLHAIFTFIFFCMVNLIIYGNKQKYFPELTKLNMINILNQIIKHTR